MRKRLLAVAATALMPVVGLLVYNQIASRRERSLEIHEQAAHAARLAASEVEQILDGARALLIAISALPAVVDLDPAACSTALGRVADSLTMTGAILVLGADKKLVCDSQGNKPGVDFSERSYVNEALVSADFVVGEYTVSKLTQTAVLPVSMPIRRSGKTVGVVATGIRLDWLQARVVERVIAPGSAVTIADRNGIILARQPFPDRFVGTQIPERYRYLLRAIQPGTIELKSQDGTTRIMGYRPVTASFPLYVSTGTSPDEAFSAINRMTWVASAMLLMSALFATAAAVYVGDRFILRPIEQIIRVIERWKDGELEARTAMAGHHGELGLVGSAVDGLLEELANRAEATRAAEEHRNLVVGELAHRMKNTLAVISAIARQTFRDAEQLPVFSERLGALGRAYEQIIAGHDRGTDMRSVIEATLAPYGPETGAHFNLAGPFCPIPADIGLALSLILHELATNAAKYGSLMAPHGRVEVSWSIGDGRVAFLWREDGGPPVTTPLREGFGTKLVRRAFPASYRPETRIDFRREGLRFDLSFDLAMPNRQ